MFQVELLHGLVYQTLEYISEKNRKYAVCPGPVCPSASCVDTSLIPLRHNKQTAESQQRDADGASAEQDDGLVRHAVM